MKFLGCLTLSINFVLLIFFVPPASAESLQKLVEFKRGRVVEADVTNIVPARDQLYVVGVINSRRNVMLFVYRGTETEARSEVELGSASSIAVSKIGNPNTNDSDARKFVSVMRDSNGELRAILWAISSDGRTLDRLDTITGPAINRVDVASNGNSDARVVAERANGNLMVRMLRLTGGNRLSFSEGENYGRVKALALERGQVGGLAMQIGNNTLRITSFLTGDQSGVFRGATNEGGEISDLDIVALDDFSSGAWVTITSSKYVNTEGFRPNHCVGAPIVIPYGPIGRGKLIAWQNDSILSNELKRVGEYEFATRQGLAHEVAAARHNSFRPSWFITGHLGYGKPCGLKPRLELHLWEFDEDDGFRKAATTKLGGDYRGLAMSDFGLVSNSSRISRFVTVMHGRTNELLKIAVWEADSSE